MNKPEQFKAVCIKKCMLRWTDYFSESLDDTITPGEIYTCAKHKYFEFIRIYKDKDNEYSSDIIESNFNQFFVSTKQYRKLKLQRINDSNT